MLCNRTHYVSSFLKVTHARNVAYLVGSSSSASTDDDLNEWNGAVDSRSHPDSGPANESTDHITQDPTTGHVFKHFKTGQKKCLGSPIVFYDFSFRSEVGLSFQVGILNDTKLIIVMSRLTFSYGCTGTMLHNSGKVKL